MKIDIDFSIFDSPVTAYGNVTGDIEVQSIPSVGDVVELLSGKAIPSFKGFSGKMKVNSVIKVEGIDTLVFGLEDVVVESRAIAEELARWLESELGLFCIDYDQ